MAACWSSTATFDIPLTVVFDHVPLTMCCPHIYLGASNTLRPGGKRCHLPQCHARFEHWSLPKAAAPPKETGLVREDTEGGLLASLRLRRVSLGLFASCRRERIILCQTPCRSAARAQTAGLPSHQPYLGSAGRTGAAALPAPAAVGGSLGGANPLLSSPSPSLPPCADEEAPERGGIFPCLTGGRRSRRRRLRGR